MSTPHSAESEVQLGSRTIVVGTSEVATSSTSFRNRALVQPDLHLLVIKANWKGRLIGLCLALIFGGWVTVAVFAIWFWPAGWLYWFAVAAWGVGILVGMLVFAFGLFLLFDTRCFRFDQGTGELLYGSLGFRRRRPLAHILAVQVLRRSNRFGDHDDSGAEFPPAVGTDELNLVLDDAGYSRLNVSCHGDTRWTHESARKLAEFLGVPLLESSAAYSQTIVVGQSTALTPAADPASPATDPLPAAAASFTSKRLAWESPTCLLLGPNLFMRGFAVIMLGMGIAALTGFLVQFETLARKSGVLLPALIGCLVPSVFILVGLVFFVGRRFRFDRDQGELCVRTFWSLRRRPLADILAIQLIPGGVHQGHRSFSYSTYQLNLVFGDAARTRWNLANEIGVKWSLQVGQQLTRFLQVPFLIQLPDGEAPPGPRARQPVVVAIGSRTLEVDRAPYVEKHNAGAIYSSRIQACSDDRLVVRHHASGCAGLILGAFLVIATLCSGLLAVTAAPVQVFAVVLGVLAVPFLLLASLFYLGYHRFDRTSGILTYGLGLISSTRLLSDLLAVQLIPGADARGQATVELNLIVDDPCEPRLPLARSPHREPTRQLGKEVADFLRVPLLEQSGADEPAA